RNRVSFFRRMCQTCWTTTPQIFKRYLCRLGPVLVRRGAGDWWNERRIVYACVFDTKNRIGKYCRDLVCCIEVFLLGGTNRAQGCDRRQLDYLVVQYQIFGRWI